jgi:hypothetical protein
MRKVPSHLKLVSDEELAPKNEIVVIASITQIEVVVPWYLRALAPFIPSPYWVTLQEFKEEYTNPLDIPTRTKQCNSFEELRICLMTERQRVYHRGKLAVVDYTHQLEGILFEFNQ